MTEAKFFNLDVSSSSLSMIILYEIVILIFLSSYILRVFYLLSLNTASVVFMVPYGLGAAVR